MHEIGEVGHRAAGHRVESTKHPVGRGGRRIYRAPHRAQHVWGHRRQHGHVLGIGTEIAAQQDVADILVQNGCDGGEQRRPVRIAADDHLRSGEPGVVQAVLSSHLGGELPAQGTGLRWGEARLNPYTAIGGQCRQRVGTVHGEREADTARHFAPRHIRSRRNCSGRR